MSALLCVGEAAYPSACAPVEGAEAVYFGADQPRITAEAFVPWSALGIDRPPQGGRIRLAISATAWHRSRWMSLSGLPPAEDFAHPEHWAVVRLGSTVAADSRKSRPGS
jgi:hypothetical protein